MAPQIRKNQIWLLIVSDEEMVDPIREGLKGWAERHNWLFTPEQREYFSISAGRYIWRCGIRVINENDVLEQLNFGGIRLITAARYLEYQSVQWLDSFLDRCAEYQTAIRFTENYSGHLRWIPSDFKDATLLAAWHRAKRKKIGDKNQVLADRAVYSLIEKLGPLDYELYQNRSKKQFGKKDETFILKQLLAMDEEVRTVIREKSLETLDYWLSKKRYAVSGGITKLEMGLTDVLAIPEV